MTNPVIETRAIPAPPAGRTGWPWQPAPTRQEAGELDAAMPLVSVVVPSFAQGRFIEETIRSVLLQDYPRVQLIVIDGGSQDETTGILTRYDDWIDYWVSEPDRGQTHAINKGLERATGEIVTYLNSDDLLHPGALRTIVEAFRAHPEAAVVHGVCLYVDEGGRERFRQSATVGGFLDYLRIWDRLWTGDYITQPEAFIRRSALEAVGPFREELHSVMDLEMWLRLLSHGYVFHAVPRPIAHFRTYASQKSSVDPGHELFSVVEEYIAAPHAGLSPETQRALRAELGPARAKILVRAAVAANVLGRRGRAARYCLAAVAADPGILRDYLFWSTLADPLKRLVPASRHDSVRRLIRRRS